MRKYIEQVEKGDKIYVVYNYIDEDKIEEFFIAEANVLENKPNIIKIDVSDRYDYEPEYKVVNEHYIKFVVPSIGDYVFGRSYCDFYSKRGTMSCSIEYQYRKDKDIRVDVFIDYEDAKEYLIDLCNSRKKMIQDEIDRRIKQIEKYNNSLESIK